ncbi:hypothetical protein EF908_24120 [Streptomyces sp. WAC04770]|nr:hypothetical protein [Streptomyces sp. WAC04770]RST21050.1 hypothetical protein EF908_24120 [Streptomyces sp. WAC04770]
MSGTSGGAAARADTAAGPVGPPPDWAPVDAFGTGYLVTRVLRHTEGGWLWIRRPGERRPVPFTPVPPAFRAAVTALPEPEVRLSLGAPAGTDRLYSAPGPAAVGHRMLGAGPDTDWSAVEQLLAGTGRLLRALHSCGPAADALPAAPPPGAARLAGWLVERPADGPAGALYTAARQRLGALRLACVLDWSEDAGEPGPTPVALHGGTSVGSLVPGEGPYADTGALLAGEELARGPASYDVGWLLGELAELRRHHLDRGDREAAAHCTGAGLAFLRGYDDRALDRKALGRTATLRILTHAHDFAAYVGWASQLLGLLDLVADLVDTDGLAALPDNDLPDNGNGPRTT